MPYFKAHADKMADAIDTVRQCREAVGVDVDLCVEIHRRLTPSEAVVLARGIEPYHPFFYEDPIAAGLLGRDGGDGGQDPHPHRHRRAAAHDLRVRDAAAAGRRAVRAARRLPVRRPDPRQKDRRPGRGALRPGRPAQSARPGEHGGLHATRGLHPELRPAGVSAGGGPPAEERPGPQDARSSRTASWSSRTRRASAWSWPRTPPSGIPTGRGPCAPGCTRTVRLWIR